MKRSISVLAALAVLCGAPTANTATATTTVRQRPVVVAVMEPAGFNVLHEEFRTNDGKDPVLPVGMPASTPVTLPSEGSFADRLGRAQGGPLGSLAPGRLYRLRGTRIIGVLAGPGGSTPVDLFASPEHGTGVAGALGGLRHGTDPDVLLVLVTGVDRQAWEWVAKQPWIDFVEASYLTVNGATTVGGGHTPSVQEATCEEGPSVQRLIANGRAVFSAAGNTEQVGQAQSPSGLPGVVHVGGVSSTGKTWLPGDPSPVQEISLSTPTRPYDIGELYSFPSLAYMSLTGTQPFGGTSGATPRLTGDAARLLSYARRVLGTPFGDKPRTDLAWSGRGSQRPTHGPLADGRLTGQELTELLFATAQPAEVVEGARFALEGYGAYNAAATRLAEDVLAGRATPPTRTADDTTKTVVDLERTTAFNSTRCG